ERLARLEVLERRGLVGADLLGAAQALLDRDLRGPAAGVGYLERLGHHRGHELPRLVVPADLLHRRAGQRAQRVERDVAHELDPGLVAHVLLDRALQAALDHGLAELPAAVGHRAVRLADRGARALEVAGDARGLELGARVDDAADRALGRDRLRDGAAGVDGLDLASGVRPVDAVEVPPRDAVLGREA